MWKVCFSIIIICHSQRLLAVDEVLSSPVFGDQVVPQYGKPDDDRLPGDNVLPHLDLRQDPLLQKVLEKADQKLIELTKKHQADVTEAIPSNTVESHPTPERVIPRKTPPKVAKATLSPRTKPDPVPPEQQLSFQPPSAFSGRNMQVFHQNAQFATRLARVPTHTLPSNSIALATIVAGVKVRKDSTMRMPLRIDYSWLGPNKAVLEMSGCEAYINVHPDISVERLYGDKGNLSCRSPNGETFNIPFTAHIVDPEDNYVGVNATMVLNGKLKAALLSILSDGAGAFGRAMAAAQVTTQVQTSTEGNGISGANVTGDKNKYIAGQTIAGSTGRFLNWHVDLFQMMEPTEDVPSGKQVFLMIDGEVQIPKVFFGNEVNSGLLVRRVNTGSTLMRGVK